MIELIKEVGMSPEFIMYISVNLITLGVIYGNMRTQIKYIERAIDRLEEKQDKHNGLIERMSIVENRLENAGIKINKNEEKIEDHLENPDR